MNILAIESSCDETSAAVVQDGKYVLSNIVASSHSMHEKYGGILPEIASREQLRTIIPVLQQSLSLAFPQSNLPVYTTIKTFIDAIAITIGPGLIGSLLIGVEAAKTIAMITGKPLLPVHHVLAHMYANFLITDQKKDNSIQFPAVSLVVSGGHTELFLMKNEKTLQWMGGTIDDAAGEAFDKTARLIGLGSGGGLAIQQAAEKYSATAAKSQLFLLPRPLIHEPSVRFSFSGLKTAVMREWKKVNQNTQEIIEIFSWEVQEAIADVLVEKTKRAVNMTNAKSILLSGGVSANTKLREKMAAMVKKDFPSTDLHIPPVALCTDNAAYIGSYAYYRSHPVSWKTIDAKPDLSVEITE